VASPGLTPSMAVGVGPVAAGPASRHSAIHAGSEQTATP